MYWTALVLALLCAPAAMAQEPAERPVQPTVKEPARSRSVEAIYQQRDALFERRFTIEPGITYSRFDRRLINLSGFLALDAIFLGTINVQQVKSDLFIFDLSARWGVTDRLQLDLNVPQLYRHSAFFSGGGGGASGTLTEATVSNSGLGDVSFGLSYHLLREAAGRPDLVVIGRLKAPTGEDPYGIKLVTPDPNNTNLEVPERLPTGSGVWTASLGLSWVKSADPAILYGSIGVIHNFKRNFDDISSEPGVVTPGEVDLRNAVTWSLGAAFALNEQMSMSFGFGQLLSQAMRTRPQDGDWSKIVGSDANAIAFNFGVTYSISANTVLVTNFGMGLTPDAPDFSMSFRLPYSF